MKGTGNRQKVLFRGKTKREFSKNFATKGSTQTTIHVEIGKAELDENDAWHSSPKKVGIFSFSSGTWSDSAENFLGLLFSQPHRFVKFCPSIQFPRR